MGQLSALTGIDERRWWHKDHVLSDGAIVAAEKVIGPSPISLPVAVHLATLFKVPDPVTVASSLVTETVPVVYTSGKAKSLSRTAQDQSL